MNLFRSSMFMMNSISICLRRLLIELALPMMYVHVAPTTTIKMALLKNSSVLTGIAMSPYPMVVRVITDQCSDRAYRATPLKSSPVSADSVLIHVLLYIFVFPIVIQKHAPQCATSAANATSCNRLSIITLNRRKKTLHLSNIRPIRKILSSFRQRKYSKMRRASPSFSTNNSKGSTEMTSMENHPRRYFAMDLLRFSSRLTTSPSSQFMFSAAKLKWIKISNVKIKSMM
mmetsp:Transcript_13820/g.22047  ORF Transcript_13820/g.22047 Transcript_13820/m.22047 type:complete len:230 (-) Transcript_13820:322-1011(-)